MESGNLTDSKPVDCPGVSKLVRPVPEYVECPNCKGSIEFWSDEDMGKCYDCDREYPKALQDASCLDWCPQADNCRVMIKENKSS